MFFDAHLHLADEYKSTDLDSVKAVIDSAKKDKVERFISNSINLRTNFDNISIAKAFQDVYLGLGIYPTEFRAISSLELVDKVFELYHDLEPSIKKKVLIGEIGLDFKESSLEGQEIQKKGFLKQIQFAKENNLFLEVHSRYAVSQTLKTLVENKVENAIMHWYTDSKKYVTEAVKQGYYITLGPSYIYSHDRVYNIIKDIPLEFILFETDYPVTFNGIIQEPRVIINLAKQYAKDFDVDIKGLAKVQEKSFKRIFSL